MTNKHHRQSLTIDSFELFTILLPQTTLGLFGKGHGVFVPKFQLITGPEGRADFGAKI